MKLIQLLNGLMAPKTNRKSRKSRVNFPCQGEFRSPESLEDRALLAAVFWDGGAGTNNWSDAANWSNDVLPGGTDDVTINRPAAIIQLNGMSVEVASLTTTFLQVTSAQLTISGPFLATGTGIGVTGPDSLLVAYGAANVDGTSLSASNGAFLSLPGATEYRTIDGVSYITAEGLGSRISLPGITSLTGVRCDIGVGSGGRIDLPNLATVATGRDFGIFVNSGIVDVSSLTAVSARGFLIIGAEGTLIAPNLATTFNWNLGVHKSGWSIPSLTKVENGSITLRANADLSRIEDVDGSSLYAYSGAILSLPAVTSYSIIDAPTVIGAEGASSLISLPGITSLTGVRCDIGVSSGGRVDLPNLVTISTGRDLSVYVNSGVIDFSALTTVSARGFLIIGAEGTLIAPNLASTTSWNINIQQTGWRLPRLTRVENGSITTYVDAVLDVINDIDSSSLYAFNDAMLALPSVASYSTIEGRTFFSAYGVGSGISLPAITSLTGVACDVEIYPGGLVELPKLTSVSAGSVRVFSSGTLVLGTNSPESLLNGVKLSTGAGSEIHTTQVVLGPASEMSGFGTILGNVVNQNLISPGFSPGAITIAGDYVQTATGRLAIEVAGGSPGTGFDVLNVGGTASLNGQLQLSATGGFVPTIGQEFVFLNAATVSGTFSAITGASISSGVKLNTAYQPTSVKLIAGPDVPIADIVDVTPDPRNTSVGTVTITFDKAVTGVEISDFSLTRDGSSVDLSSLSVTQVNASQYTVNLSSVTTQDGTYVLLLKADGSGIADGAAMPLITDASDTFLIDTVGPRVSAVRFDDGTAQRSVVRSITVDFDSLADVTPGAFVVKNSNGSSVNVNATLSTVNNKTRALLTFSGPYADASGSLIDGNYQLQILATHVRDTVGNQLDGNPSLAGSENYVDQFFRLYGDIDGDRDVDQNDYSLFQSSYRKQRGNSGYIAGFDSDGDGDVDAADLLVFRRQFGKRLNP